MIDWRGECVAIVASGPSTKSANVALLQNRIHVIAIKKNVELCPWADVVYGCDAAWWKSVHGLPEYKGLKFSWAEGGSQFYKDIHPVEIEKNNDALVFDQSGVVGSGGNSGFQALNLAVQFGARGILLIGFDMQDRSGAHWYGRNNWHGANNPSDDNFRRWHKAFAGAAAVLAKMDIQVFNASPDSALRCFQHKTIDAALEAWGLGNIESAQVDMDRVRSKAGRGGCVRGRKKLNPAASDTTNSNHGPGAAGVAGERSLHPAD